MLLPVMLTLTRGNPPVKQTFTLAETFDDVILDVANIKEYSAFCGFAQTDSIPATWFYLLAQRAQIALILHRKFPLAAPGLVHLTNSLEILAQPRLDKPVTITSSVVIEGKERGSLFPTFTVDILQEGRTIAHCTSGYIAKRSGGSSEKSSQSSERASQAVPDFSAAKSAGTLTMPDAIGWEYAKVSGDYNPIHIAGVMARAFGLPGKLAHGWYSVSMFVSALERIKNSAVTKVDVQFQKPILLPATVALEYLDEGVTTLFRMTSEDKRTVHLMGKAQ